MITARPHALVNSDVTRNMFTNNSGLSLVVCNFRQQEMKNLKWMQSLSLACQLSMKTPNKKIIFFKRA